MLRNFFKSISIFVFLVVLGSFIGGIVSFFILTRDLPDVENLKVYRPSHATEVYSADGTKIGEFTKERRYPVDFETIPRHVILAFVAAEDSKFYTHSGIDFVAFIRAAISNVVAGRFAQGASTITQQVARSILLGSRAKKISRKIREMILAYRMEQSLTKDQILNLYLSEIYLGHGAYGIGAAARNYFRKKVVDLDLAEAALLAGLPQRPAEWDPFRNPTKSKQRQRYVLNRMKEEEYISAEEAADALAAPLKLYPLEDINLKAAPYFVEYVRTYLMKKYGGENVLRSGYKVYTTVRFDFQKKAEQALDTGLRAVDKRLGWRGPIQHINSDDKIEAFLNKQHQKVLAKESPSRLLNPDVTKDNNTLFYDMTPFQERNTKFYGETPIQEGSIYQAVVTEVMDQDQVLVASVGKTPVRLSITSMDWVKVAGEPLKSISQILVSGDVVHVKVSKIDRASMTVEATLEQQPEVQGAILSYEIDTGVVMAMVGGRDFKKSEFNIALQAKRQVGSTFKPLVYAAAVDKGLSPSSIVTDSPLVFKVEGDADLEFQGDDWKPRNYGEKFVGEIPLRTALIKSMNVPTIKVLNEIGVDYTIEYARRLGITAPLPRDLTISLGSWSSSLEEMMRAYSIFPRLGATQDLVYIQKVVAPSGEVLEDNAPVPSEDKILGLEKGARPKVVTPEGGEEEAESENVISPQTAYVMTDMLKSVVREGTGRRVAKVGNVAGKTGTSNDFHDAWFIGYTPSVMTGVWVGFETSRPMAPGEAGGKAAAPIFADYMGYVVKQYPEEDFPIPDDIQFAYVNRKTGALARSGDPNRVLVAFKRGTVPDATGENIPRVREPGVRATTTEEENTFSEYEAEGSKGKNEDISELLREGYDE